MGTRRTLPRCIPEGGQVKGVYSWRPSPAFDNGTALNYNIPEEQFQLAQDPLWLKARLESPKYAHHHMKWSLADETPINFYEFMRKFVVAYPEAKSIIEGSLDFDRARLESAVEPLCGIETDPRFRLTPRRLAFMLDRLFDRKGLLERALER